MILAIICRSAAITSWMPASAKFANRDSQIVLPRPAIKGKKHAKAIVQAGANVSRPSTAATVSLTTANNATARPVWGQTRPVRLIAL